MAATVPNLDSRPFSMRLPSPLSVGLATVVLIVAAIGLRIGIPIYREQAAIREIKRLGGWVETLQGGPGWLRSILGNDRMARFDNVFAVNLAGTPANDETCAHFAGTPKLRLLILDQTQITDAGLARLANLRNIVGLDLGSTQITDAGLANLAGMSDLRALELDCTHVTDAGLSHVGKHSNLIRLNLAQTRVSGDGLVHLKGLSKLESLRLTGTQIGDPSLEHLSPLLPLRELYLNDTKITDAGLVRLSRFKQLARIDLGGTQVSKPALGRYRWLEDAHDDELKGIGLPDFAVDQLREGTPSYTIKLDWVGSEVDLLLPK